MLGIESWPDLHSLLGLKSKGHGESGCEEYGCLNIGGIISGEEKINLINWDY
jgi:hypothetical protein